MRKTFIISALLISIGLFQFCSSSKNVAAVTPPAITYQKNLRPVIAATCAPCHIAGKGNKKSLDNYAGTKETIDDIIVRIQKNPGERGFMPARHDKLPDSTIALFNSWKQSGMLEK